jgi:hypothetical protein
MDYFDVTLLLKVGPYRLPSPILGVIIKYFKAHRFDIPRKTFIYFLLEKPDGVIEEH